MAETPLFARPWPYLLAAIAAVAIYVATSTEVKPGDPRPDGTAADIEALAKRDDVNLLFILVDTLRADRLGTYGYERNTSPLFDHLASNGVRFGRHLSQSSWTKASMASLWTSLYPNRSGVTRFDDLLSKEAIMPAERLREAGFRTAAIWRNGWVSGYFGFDQGFEVYHRPVPEPATPGVRQQNPTLTTAGTDMSAIVSAEDYIRVHKGDRWFLYVHLMDVHEYTYDEDSAQFGTSYSDTYDNSILRVNFELARLYEFLIEQGLADNTLVVLTADHGEAFSERGFEGHARKVYRETTEVPFIVSFPFKLPGGVVVGSRTRGVDVWPTLLDLLGHPVDPAEGLDGRSRVPDLLAAARGEAPAPDSTEAIGPTIAHLDQSWGMRKQQPRPTVAIVEGPLRYVQSLEPSGVVVEQLYDASDDPGELADVFAARPDDAGRMRELANAYLEEKPPWGETRDLDLDEIQLNQLRALGYQLP
ncbi:MAG: sulfatase [Spirochaetaceae bacterium]|nr:sulfatase [Myxococcales bacterium]MCB9724717.1 sulfatase [Spirochaetaceae bacterium]